MCVSFEWLGKFSFHFDVCSDGVSMRKFFARMVIGIGISCKNLRFSRLSYFCKLIILDIGSKIT